MWSKAKDAAASAAEAVGSAAAGAAAGASKAALATALDGLAEAVRAVAARREPYSITLTVAAGPVSLSVTVPADETAEACGTRQGVRAADVEAALERLHNSADAK